MSLKEIHNQWIETIEEIYKVQNYVKNLNDDINSIVASLVYGDMSNNDDNRKLVSKQLNDIVMKFEEITLDAHNEIQKLRKITVQTKCDP